MTAVTSIIAAEKFLYLEDPQILHKRRKFAIPAGSSVGTQNDLETVPLYQPGNTAHYWLSLNGLL